MIYDIINDYWFYITIENDDWKFGWGRQIQTILKTLPKDERRYDYINKRWAVRSHHKKLFNPFIREPLESYDVNEFLIQFD